MNVDTLDEIDVFLSHHGIKGQHWGIRNSKTSSSNKKNRDSKKGFHITKKEVGIGLAAVIATGVSAAALIFRKNGGVPIKHLNVKLLSEGEAVHTKIMKEIAEKNMRIIDSANRHLQLNDNYLNIPHPQRVVLQTDYWKNILLRGR